MTVILEPGNSNVEMKLYDHTGERLQKVQKIAKRESSSDHRLAKRMMSQRIDVNNFP